MHQLDRSSLYVTAKVRPKDATSVNLDYFDQIEINGGELHLGDSAELVEGGLKQFKSSGCFS